MPSADSAYASVLVVGLWEGQPLNGVQPAEVLEAAGRPEYSSIAGDWAEAFLPDGSRVIAVCLGPRSTGPGAAFRKGIAAACRRVEQVKAVKAELKLPEDAASSHAAAAGETVGMLAWNGGIYKSAPSPVPAEWTCDREAFSRGLVLASCVNRARTLAFTPASAATPSYMAEKAREAAEECGLSWSVFHGEALEAERMAGLLAVGQGSDNPSCLIRLEWNPEGSEEAPLVLLGKTITYDTGGLSIKDKKGMPGMKGDKAGGCAVLAAMEAIARVYRPRRRIVGLLVAAENSISARSYRPDDVIVFRNGVSVEVTNTDAEGRLVLADGLCWATEVEKAAAIVDIATLTGGVVVALGDVFAGLYATEDGLAESLAETGDETGDRLWRLPLDPAYDEMMKSDVADLVNSNLNGKAHSVQGATFLKKFVGPGIPWAHLDIAGVSNAHVDFGAKRPGPTGFGARLLARWASEWSQ